MGFMAHGLRIFITLLALTTVMPSVAAPAKSAQKARPKIMVPPPPPEIPLVTGRDGALAFSTYGVPIDLMQAKDLEKLKSRLQQRLEILTKKADERTADISDGKQRVVQFEQLFTEGVVSKKDLRNAKRDLETLENTDPDIDQQVSDVKSDLARVEKRLKTLTAKKGPTKQVH
jgi:hypothetical protein